MCVRRAMGCRRERRLQAAGQCWIGVNSCLCSPCGSSTGILCRPEGMLLWLGRMRRAGATAPLPSWLLISFTPTVSVLEHQAGYPGSGSRGCSHCQSCKAPPWLVQGRVGMAASSLSWRCSVPAVACVESWEEQIQGPGCPCV